MREYKTIICVFAGRERYMKILNKYIDLGLKKGIIDEYHLINFTFNKNDYNYILNLYEEMSKKYNNRIFIHYSEENIKTIEESEKFKILNRNQNLFNNVAKKWKHFYNMLGEKIGDEKSVIIKCDDDVLFIDIYKLEKAFYYRWVNKYPFIMHSNCINNGVCAYYQRDKFEKIKNELNKYPKGGICGPIFEKPELSLVMHYDFLNKLLEKEKLNENLEYFYLDEDKFISTRISINFVFMHGEDIPYLKQIGDNDEYDLSSKLPEKLVRPNLIINDMITSHYSYGMQDKILKQRPDIIKMYEELSEKYMESRKNIENDKKIEIKNKYLAKEITNNRFFIKNPLGENDYFIKDIKSGKYIYYDIKSKKLKMGINEYKSYFEIMKINSNNVNIMMGIHPFTRFSIPNDMLNDMIYMKSINDKNEKFIELKEIDYDYKVYNIILPKYKLYLTYDNEKDELKFRSLKENENEKEYMWELKKCKDITGYREYTEVEKIYNEETDSYMYKDLNLSILEYNNVYSGWKLETLFGEEYEAKYEKYKKNKINNEKKEECLE